MPASDNALPHNIERALRRCDLVSFDVFGTLLIRMTPTDKAIFDIVEAKATNRPLQHGTLFSTQRLAADTPSEREGIPNLEEIYSRLNYPTKESSRRMDLEKMVERNALVVNPYAKRIYQRALDLGKTIVITSDMYLSSEFLSELLQEKGYQGFQDVFVSCEHNCNKGSGELFDVLLNRYPIAPSKVLHVGDSLKADIRGASKRHIPSLYIGPSVARKITRKLNASPSLPLVFDFEFSDKSSLYNKGFQALGPLLVGFAQWLHSSLDLNKNRRLLFLARDTKLLMDAYLALYPEEKETSHYLYVSRRSIGLACLSDCTDLSIIKEEISFQRYISWAGLMDNLGISEDTWKSHLSDESFPFQELYHQDIFFTNPDIIRMYEKILPVVESRRQEQRRLLTNYLAAEGLDNSSVIVDIGWHGTIQRMLQRLTGHPITGLYVGTSTTQDCDARGFLFDDDHMENDSVLGAFGPLFETFFFAGHGTTDHYEEGSTGETIPILDQCEYTETEMSSILEFQHGALDFVKYYADSELVDYLPIDATTALKPLRSIGYNPSNADVRLFGPLKYLEYGTLAPLIETKTTPSIYLHPKKIVAGFFQTKWKSGYLRQVFKLPLPYGSLYNFARRFFNGSYRKSRK